MAFVPPVFSKFGKACSDLLTKKWEAKKSDFNNKFSVKSESQKVTVTSTVTAEDDSSKQLGGKVNVTYKDKAVGEFSTEGSTDGSYKTTAKLTKLKPGATVSGETTCARKGVSGKATVEYVAEPAAVSVEYNHKKDEKTVAVAAAVGFEGFSGGVQATIDTAKIAGEGDKKEAVNVEGAIQYEDGNLVATVKVEKAYTLSAALYHNVSSALQLASKLVYNSTKPEEHAVVLGAQYAYNASTNVKAKVEVKGNKDYTYSYFVEHKLSNPNVVVGLVSESAVTAAASANKFGVSLAFGEN